MNIIVGKVLKAHGIKGEIKLGIYLDSPKQLSSAKMLYIGTKEYKINSVRINDGYCYLFLDGVCDRNAAEILVDWEAYAEKEELNVPEGNYFIDDILGCRVYLEDGTYIGQIKDVLQYGGADVFVTENGGKAISFPFLSDLYVSVNIETKTVILQKKRFSEVAVYDD